MFNLLPIYWGVISNVDPIVLHQAVSSKVSLSYRGVEFDLTVLKSTQWSCAIFAEIFLNVYPHTHHNRRYILF